MDELTYCLKPESLQMFLQIIGDENFDIVSNVEIIIRAEMGDVLWVWVDEVKRFCIDGLAGKLGTPV